MASLAPFAAGTGLGVAAGLFAIGAVAKIARFYLFASLFTFWDRAVVNGFQQFEQLVKRRVD